MTRAARIQNRRELLTGVPELLRARRELALDLFDAALAEVQPQRCTEKAIEALRNAGERLDDCTVFAFGKAARGMAEAALQSVQVRDGFVLGFESGTLGPLEMLQASHPLPADDAPEHGRRVLERAHSLGADDVALVLISGGGSAMLELPVEGVSLEDMQQTTQALLGCGADIEETNAVRSALSQLKGGGLARALAPARVLNVVISDVVGSPLHAIASGPSVMPSKAAGKGVQDVLARYDLEQELPAPVLTALRTPAPAVTPGAFAHVRSLIAADNLTAQRAMLDAAAERGMTASLDPAPLSGEARDQARRFIQRAGDGADIRIGGGETTVTLRGDGRGGRNQELVLGAAELVDAGLFASLGTDGIDGASEDAGGLIDGHALARASAMGVSIEDALARNDSNGCLRALGCHLHTGRTGTNVTDVCLWIP